MGPLERRSPLSSLEIQTRRCARNAASLRDPREGRNAAAQMKAFAGVGYRARMAADKPFGFQTHPSVTSSAPPEAVYDVIADLRNHVVWSGEMAASEGFRMLSLDAPEGPATVGTTFSSSGSAQKDTFHDLSVVTEANRPSRFTIETDATLERRSAPTWEGHFIHRYDITAEGAGSRIVYTETIERVNYVPYWLKPGIRTIFKPWVNSADRKQLRNLARLAEERSTG